RDLTVTGVQTCALPISQCQKLRQFVEAGGTIFAEACCSRPVVRQGFQNFVRETFPEYPLTELAAEHPIWSSLFKLRPGQFTLLEIGRASCRERVEVEVV